MLFYSIILPVFNRAHLVGATLDSIVAQSENDWEIIVVDDGSTDETLAVLEGYCAQLGERMRVLQQSHAGPGAARNGGVATARGRYIAFLDSDDLWFPWTLEFYRRQLQNHDYPAFLVGAPLVFQNETQWLEAVKHSRAPSQTARVAVYQDYLQASLPPAWLSASSFVVRRDALAHTKFCARPINCEDIDFTLQMGTAPGFVNIQNPPTFGYRQHAGGITGHYIRTVRGTEWIIASELAGRYPGGPARRRQRLSILGSHVRPALLEFIARGYRRRAWRALKHTFFWHLELGRFRFLLGFLLRALFPRRRIATRRSKSARE